MTLTPVKKKRSTFWWVPVAAGWTVGVIATLSLIASVSPVIRWAIRVPREFVNDYIFNFPDTSFAWSFILTLLAAALTARKRIAWVVLLGIMVVSGAMASSFCCGKGRAAAPRLQEGMHANGWRIDL